MKRISCIFLTLLLVASLAACGGNDKETAAVETEQATASATPTETAVVYDFEEIFAGESSEVVYSQIDEDVKEAIVSDAAEDGIEVTFQEDNSTTFTKPLEGTSITQTEDGTWIPGTESSMYTDAWPENEFTVLIPKPPFVINNAGINETTGAFVAQFLFLPFETIRTYVQTLRDAGFTIDETLTDTEDTHTYIFSASNADGYNVQIAVVGEVCSLGISKVETITPEG